MQDITPERDRTMSADYSPGQASSRGTLKHLDDLDDYEVAEGEPDIRGWTVRTSDGREIGEVDDLLVDLGAMKVRYMDVELDKDALDLDEERHVLVPISSARLNDDEDVVIVSRMASDFAGIPAYMRGGLTPDYERTVYETYTAHHAGDRDFFGTRRRSVDDAYIVAVRKE